MAREPQPSRIADLTEPEAPDAVRRRDTPEPGAPDTVPRPGEGAPGTGGSPSEDGGADDHPIHDDDLEDRGPEDYEKLTEEAARTGIKGD